MKKLFYSLSLLVAILALASCQENEETGEYDNWKVRNQQYVDSVARLADAGIGGWSKMVAFNLVDSVESLYPNNNHYIYIQKMEKDISLMVFLPEVNIPMKLTLT